MGDVGWLKVKNTELHPPTHLRATIPKRTHSQQEVGHWGEKENKPAAQMLSSQLVQEVGNPTEQ